MKKAGLLSNQKYLVFVVSAGFLIFLALLAQNVFQSSAAAVQNQLSPAERARRERDVQAVYHKHRIYPEINRERKPTLDEILPAALTRAKVEEISRKSNALEQFWNVKITPEMLQAEIERMSRDTRQPEVLREIFAALDNDPYLIAECLARPNLVERFVSALDQADFERRWQAEREQVSPEIGATDFSYRLPEIASPGGGVDDTWKPLPVLPDGFFEHTAVWTGAEMLVWGGTNTGSFTSRVNSGSRYNPATDTWLPITGSGAPERRRAHTAIWTGTEMIVWGGCGPATQFCGLASGGRYNPATDSWMPVAFDGAPGARLDHTAVWTGDRMIVWGGCVPNANFTVCTNLQSGGMYFPANDQWILTDMSNAPSARRNHAAVWTGTEMLIWGGFPTGGGRFNPNTNTWTPMSTTNQPQPRERPAYVWTGTEMIVWGGVNSSQQTVNTGGRYNPATDTWTPTSLTNAPTARYLHTGVWTGTEMIIWGGNVATLGEGWLNTGARYNPATDSWTPTSVANAPSSRDRHKAVWTGTEMILWGGRRDPVTGKTGGRYNPANDSWLAVSTNDPPANVDSEAVWTGTELLIWGGAFVNRGARFNYATGVWSPLPQAGIDQRDHGFTLIWTGTEMIVWGGQTGPVLTDTGARFNPAANIWTPVSMTNPPGERSYHTAVWTGTEMIVWGGQGKEDEYNDGARYNPSTDTWTAVPVAPISRRYIHTAVIVSGKMVVWGGVGSTGALNDGARYDIAGNSWQPTSTVGAPSGRLHHTAVSTGTEMIVWGGRDAGFPSNMRFNTGGRYNPLTDTWTPTSLTNAPEPRSQHTAVWTGREMIVWGGDISSSTLTNTGGRYNPATDTWRPTSLFRVGTPRTNHAAVWTGRSMIVWGGFVDDGDAKAGYEYLVDVGSDPKFDFDGDGRSDIGVFRQGNWYIQQSQAGFAAFQFGISTDRLVPADYDGDGRTDAAVYRDGTWYLLRSAQGFTAAQFGLASDIPQTGDFDGDGKADLAVFRPTDGTWYLQRSRDGFTGIQFGQNGDKPVAADFDGDGKTDPAVYRGGTWYVLQSRDGFRAAQFGIASDKPVVGDYDGDGKADFAVYREGTWYLQRSQAGFAGFQFGIASDTPAPADYDGDGKTDFAVFRNGVWYLQQSTSGFAAAQFGQTNDIPIPSASVP